MFFFTVTCMNIPPGLLHNKIAKKYIYPVFSTKTLDFLLRKLSQTSLTSAETSISLVFGLRGNVFKLMGNVGAQVSQL